MLQTELDVNEFVNDLKENGRSKKQQYDVHEYPDYAGHYDFEPHPVLQDLRQVEEPESNKEVENEDPTICFVKAYARKPLGPPHNSVVPDRHRQNGIPMNALPDRSRY